MRDVNSHCKPVPSKGSQRKTLPLSGGPDPRLLQHAAHLPAGRAFPGGHGGMILCSGALGRGSLEGWIGGLEWRVAGVGVESCGVEGWMVGGGWRMRGIYCSFFWPSELRFGIQTRNARNVNIHLKYEIKIPFFCLSNFLSLSLARARYHVHTICPLIMVDRCGGSFVHFDQGSFGCPGPASQVVS